MGKEETVAAERAAAERAADQRGAAQRAAAERGFIAGQRILGVLFDLDGTLADTDDTTINSLAVRLGRLQRLFPAGDPRPLLRHLLMAVEGPMNWTLGQLDRFQLDDEAFQLNAFRHRVFGHRQREEMTLVPGVEAALRQISANYQVAMVTTRDHETATYFVQAHGLEQLFDAIVSRSDVRCLKPNPEPVLLAAKRLGLAPGACVMVGDTVVDVHAGRRAGTQTVGVLCGFGQRKDLSTADVILSSTADLPQLL